MRRRVITALMTALVLLSACGGGDEAGFEEWRAALADRSVSVTARVTSDLGDEVREYELSALCQLDGCEVTVLAPELIAGVSAKTDGNGANICYSGLVMSTGGVTPEPCSPAGALPAVADALRGAHAQSFRREGDMLAVELRPADGYSVTVFFSADMTPVRAELAERTEGRVLTSCEIIEFTIN